MKKVTFSDSSEPIKIDNQIGNTFGYCDIESVYLGRELVDISKSTSYYNYSIIPNGLRQAHIGSNVHFIDETAFGFQSHLTSLTIEEGLTEMGIRAFYGFSSLKNVKLPSSLEKIGKQAFGASALTDIVIPENVKYIDEEAFSNSRALESVMLPEGIEAIKSRAFYGCIYLGAIRLPHSLKELGEGVFEGCNRLCTPRLTSMSLLQR